MCPGSNFYLHVENNFPQGALELRANDMTTVAF